MLDDQSLFEIANLVFQWGFVYDVTWCEQRSFHASRKWSGIWIGPDILVLCGDINKLKDVRTKSSI